MSSKDTELDRRSSIQHSCRFERAGKCVVASAGDGCHEGKLTIPAASVSIHFTHTLTVPVPSMASGSTCLEPLIDVDYARANTTGCSPSREFQGKKWVFHLKKDKPRWN